MRRSRRALVRDLRAAMPYLLAAGLGLTIAALSVAGAFAVIALRTIVHLA